MTICNATIKFADDHGDNVSTFECQLEKGHEGKHRETGDMSYSDDDTMPYILEWESKHKK